MAYCTKCSTWIDDKAVECTACGYDFSESLTPKDDSWEHGDKGDLVLACYSVVLAFSTIIASIGTIVSFMALFLSRSDLEESVTILFYFLLSTVVVAGQWVVVQRVRNLPPKP